MRAALRLTVAAGAAAMLMACGSGGAPRPRTDMPITRPVPSELPDTAFGTHVLVVARSPRDQNLWVGTYGRGIFATRSDSTQLWRRITPVRGDSTSLSW